MNYSTLYIQELKQVAIQNNVPVPTGDKRKKQTWIDAIEVYFTWTEIGKLARDLVVEVMPRTDAKLLALKQMVNTQPVSNKKNSQALQVVLNSLDIVGLRKLCSQHNIQWRNARGKGKHLKKAVMIFQLEQQQISA